MLEQFLAKAQELRKKNEPFAIAVVVRREAPCSGKSGDKAIINKYGEIFGWVGGGCVKSIVIKEAEDAMRSGEARLIKIGKSASPIKQQGIMEYKMTCLSEGAVDIFLEPVLPTPHLVIIGKGAIAKALVKLGKVSGYRITAIANDAKPDTFEGVDELITQLNFQQVKTNTYSSIVVATQGEDDEKALELALKQQHAYIGFVASKKKRTGVFEYLLQSGVEQSKIDEIKSPAGIDINAKKPEEVAISILAEIIQLKNNSPAAAGFTQFDETRAEAGKPKFYINPVCGVPIDVNSPKHTIEYNGEKVYFCCDGCKIKFEQEPKKYIKKNVPA
jgi:xanthine dehydrogenase accessory factor